MRDSDEVTAACERRQLGKIFDNSILSTNLASQARFPNHRSFQKRGDVRREPTVPATPTPTPTNLVTSPVKAY